MEASSAGAEAYEGYIGRWSRGVAADFLSWLAIPPQVAWFDVACGTGALAQTVVSTCAPERVDASDPDHLRIAFARRNSPDFGVSFAVGDATHIAAPDATYGAVICGLGFPAISDTAGALAEFIRVTKPAGTVGAYVWDFDGEMQLLRYFWNEAAELEPGAEESDDERFAICRPERLRVAWQRAGLSAVETCALDTRAHFCDFDDFWRPFLSGDAPAQAYVQSLDGRRRALLRERLRSKLPIAADGSIALVTRAWAVKGIRSAGQLASLSLCANGTLLSECSVSYR